MKGLLAIDPLGAVRFTERIPQHALALDLAYARGRRVLLLGRAGELLIATLEANGLELVQTASVQDALGSMAFSRFDVLVVHPEAPDGIGFIKALKLGAPLSGTSDAELRRAVQGHELVPVVLLPLRGDDEYAVIIVPPHFAYLERMARLPLVEVILRLDVRRLLGQPVPSA